jgi:hypothetical protein
MRKPNLVRPLKTALRLLRHTIGGLAVLAFVYALGGLRADHSITRIAHPSLAPSPSTTPGPTQSSNAVALATSSDDLRPAQHGPAIAPTAKPRANKTAAGDIAVALNPGAASAPARAPASAPPARSGWAAVAPPTSRTGGYIIISRARLATLPVTGPAWQGLKAAADASAGTPDLSNMDQNNNVFVLAKALVYARTGDPRYRDEVIANLKAAVGTEGGKTLALGRELGAYALAADLVDLSVTDPGFDAQTFRPWLRRLLTLDLGGLTLQTTHEQRPNNWGTQAGASRAAVAAYLGDARELARVAQVFKGWLGDRASYAGFNYGDLSWQADPAHPVGINPVGATIGGVSVDGALPEEMRRGGAFKWPPAGTDYPWGALEGAILQAEILYQAGYDTWNWQNQALRRGYEFLFARAGWGPAGNDEWQLWLIDYRYGTGYRRGSPVSPGKNFGWSDWLYTPGT